ncbi:bifunctional phosphoribosylaminoimidazolecarboxamide formyltransferase/IMP cyclohydrolase [Enhydrobacter sp.]|jgi:phosphoribosylaminoimidazolecarboxamide formyltransferase/IMP cyclohydrolase|uniref:bifunctional phosphoribosylaminoimidazolecarboxamide formyltransferase/IMP cyclohydrolase n=1 Tax=Enhydrobacter sp. TaxID=1894999 RepID=UPI002630640E|nr:bifunctional phosphoribosylaminoimidazolecarboxamide formyltransferase/IMP cyclohydrolase [Enhydrobacter sp.]WIM11121.1 MAG: phosphoribosylaminoimidazolecarboxamide formyltransferase / IMP cyclohydrolase [Enhydrobacter sp.]
MSAPPTYIPSPTPDLARIERALISVSDKAGLVELGKALAGHGVEILSTGGSAKALREAGLEVIEVSDHTGFPEIMDGRVKTLQPSIHGGILARRTDAGHAKAMADHRIAAIDLVVVNLYPFEATVARGADFPICVENIDIGGPALIRAAAKNHDFVTVVVDPVDYPALLAELTANEGATTLALRRRLAATAYARTAAYDSAIATWFAHQQGEIFPEQFTLAARRVQILRYGENPHQQAAFYADGSNRPGIATARMVQGKELSYNNINDTEAAYECVAEFEGPACTIIKHANPCGVAIGKDITEAYLRALACDPVSAFGGIIAFNRPLDAKTAAEVVKILTEVVIAPDASEEARKVMAARRNVRLLLAGGMPDPRSAGMTLKSVAGGYLLQSRDSGQVAKADLKVVTKRAPTAREVEDLLFAFTVCKHVKSNAIVYAKDGATVGVGAGQMNRRDSSRIAAIRAAESGELAKLPQNPAIGSVVASDAFFPFPDGLLAAADAGATAVIQPGGSIRDQAVIDAADQAGLAMVFTGMRHFRH